MIRDRLIKIINSELPRKGAFKLLEEQTGISARSWGHMYNKRSEATIQQLEAIIKIFPKYSLWLASGNTLIETGQVSPELEETVKKLEGTGTDTR